MQADIEELMQFRARMSLVEETPRYRVTKGSNASRFFQPRQWGGGGFATR